MQGVLVVQDERNLNNEALDLASHVMPSQLVEMTPCDFIDSIQFGSISKSVGKVLAR